MWEKLLRFIVVMGVLQALLAQEAIPDKVDIVEMIDGAKFMGKISQIDSSKVVMEVQGQTVELDAKKVAGIQRNVSLDPNANKPRYAEITLRDKTVVVGQITRTEGDTTFVQSAGTELRLRTENIVSLRYIDVEQAKIREIEKSRKAGFEFAFKGGSPFYQHGTFKNTLKPGVFGLFELSLPHWFISGPRLNLQLGAQAGFITNQGKTASARIDLIPTNLIFHIIYPFPRSRFDAYASLLGGGNITRVVAEGQEVVSLDPSAGAELGFRFHVTSQIHARLGSQWYSVIQGKAGTLNHLGAYLGVGYRFP